MRPRIRNVLLVLAAIILLAGLGLYIHKYHHFKTNNQTLVPQAATITYHYQKLENYKLPSGAGSVTFDKPTQFKEFGSAPAKTTQALLIQDSANRTVPDVGRIAIAVVSFTASPDYLQTFSDNLSNPQKPQYTQTVSNFRQFINQRLPISYSLDSFKAFKPLSTSGITSNAWQTDFSAVSTKKDLPKLSGTFIIAFGKQAQYYFMAENVAGDWQANTAIWQQVINSLKVDQ